MRWLLTISSTVAMDSGGWPFSLCRMPWIKPAGKSTPGASPDINELRTDYAACLRKSVKRYNDGLREAVLVAEMTTHACTPALYEIRWKLLAAGTPESEATAYAAKLQVRARNKLAEMVENGF